MTKDNFINLHTHDEYSNIRLKDSTNRIGSMIDYVANTLNQKGFAMTNHDCLSNHVKYISAVKDMKKQNLIPQDFKYILGNEIYLLDENEMNEQLENKRYVSFYHFILIALDEVGHRQLRELSTRAWGRSFSYRGMDRVPTFHSDIEDIVGSERGHLVASTACLGSRFSKLALQYGRMELCIEQGYYIDSFTKKEVHISTEEAMETKNTLRESIHTFLTWCLEMFGENFYIEMQPSDQQDQIIYNNVAKRIAQAYNIPTLITTDAHYLRKEDKGLHKAFLKSDEDDETFASGGRETDDFYDTTYFMGSEEIHERMAYLGYDFVEQCIINSQQIYSKVQQYDLKINQEVPHIPLPPIVSWYYNDEITSLIEENKEMFPHIIAMRESNDNYDKYLYTQILKGLREYIEEEDLLMSLVRVNKECEEIIGISKAKQTTMSSYFITLQKIIDIIWDEAKAFVGVSRGSAAGFIINYLLQIVQINPLKQPVEMPHWRFISSSRPDFPDIDIDISSHKRDIAFRKVREYFNSFGGEVIRVATFKTESSKSAIQTACRGMGISSDTGLYLSSLIPVVRGSVVSIKDAYYGNEDKEMKPITEFVNQVNNHDGLLELALGIENIISGRGSHPCGVCAFQDVTKHTAIMKAPSGEVTTQYDLQDCEYTGSIKLDMLNTRTMSMIQICTEMLIEYGHMEWQGSLRKTYNKYLHPDKRDYDNAKYYEALNKGELLSAFQFETMVGSQALSLIKPTSLLELANANSLMRLMSDGEQPMDKYIRYKNNPHEWENDMIEFGLSEYERAILHEHLDKDYGVCSSQEGMMLLSMDERIAGFDVVESNVLRKSVAKKKAKLLETAHDLLLTKGRELGVRDVFINYVWDVQIAMQKGYSFSVLHTIGYSHILLIQLELITNYPPIYWNTAVLLVESGALSQDVESEDDNKKEKTTNYGVVASAISNLQEHNIVIALPDINRADVGFIPNEEDNSIMFGMKGISTINNDTAKLIMDNRPYTSLQDFHERMVTVKREVTLSTGKKQMKSLVSTSQTINLIKGGAFDELENKPREEILASYLRLLYPSKSKLTSANISNIIEMGIVPSHLQDCIKHHNFKEFIKSLPKHKDETSKSITWYVIDCGDDETTDYTTNYLMNHFGELVEDRDYYYDDLGYVHLALGTSRKGSFEALHKEKMKPLTQWLNSSECLDVYNHMQFEDVKRIHMKGNRAKWEMESMCYYYSYHELANVDKELYSLVNFNELPEEPIITGFTPHAGKQHPRFKLSRIAGTVLDRDRNKHTVTLLTQDGVVTVKFYGGQFSFYDKTISMIDEQTGKKVVVEDGWFKRGNLLTISGFRRQNRFSAKRYANSIYQHAVCKILNVCEDGTLELQTERAIID